MERRTGEEPGVRPTTAVAEVIKHQNELAALGLDLLPVAHQMYTRQRNSPFEFLMMAECQQ